MLHAWPILVLAGGCGLWVLLQRIAGWAPGPCSGLGACPRAEGNAPACSRRCPRAAEAERDAPP